MNRAVLCGLCAVLLWSCEVFAASPGGRARLKTPDGAEREYLVHLPKGWDGKARLPVVLVLHGGGGNAEQVEASTHMDQVADAHGFAAVYPQGTGRAVLGRTLGTWNGGFCCGSAAEEKVDDVAFLSALLDQLAKDYPVDGARIFVTGISNGALMAFVLACEASDRIAAAAPVASPGIPKGCRMARPVPMLFVHGTADPCTLYQGGAECGGCFAKAVEKAWGLKMKGNDRFPCDGAAKQLDFAARKAGCKEKEEVFFTKGEASCARRAGCAAGGEAALCRIEGAGHTWPKGSSCETGSKLCEALKEVTGKVSQDLDASEAIWEFFSRHALAREK